MKKFFALLLTLCMLGSCVAFAEEAEPQDPMAEMIDQIWYGALTQLADNFNNGSDTLEGLLSYAADSLNTWMTDADSRYTENRSVLSDAVTQLLGSASEVMGEAQYIMEDEESAAKAQALEQQIAELTAEAQQLSAETAQLAGSRLAETRDQVVASGSKALSDVINVVKNLFYVITGSVESEAQTRMGEVSDNAEGLVASCVDILQQMLAGYADSFLPAEEAAE
ncbi:MAG: hypothetical protein IJ157_11455 [Clostridia bacterium]|nr:hypothetical protein [Clostridia bacterium]